MSETEPTREQRSSGLASSAASALETLAAGSVTLLGLPYIQPRLCRVPGAAGPALLRQGLRDAELPPELTDLGDLAPEPLRPGHVSLSPYPEVEQAAQAVFRTPTRGIFVSGDHAVTDSILRGLARARRGIRLAVVVVDAHLDSREFVDEEVLHSATPFSRALEARICRGETAAVIGLREDSNSRIFTDWMREGGVHLLLVQDVLKHGVAHAARSVLARVLADADALYVSIDLDAALSGPAPGVEGFNDAQLVELTGELVSAPQLVGMDIIGCAGTPGSAEATADLAARVFLEAVSRLC